MTKTVIQLLFLSLIVGLLFSFFGVTPASFWNSMGDLMVQAWDSGGTFFGWAWMYIAIGGAVVVPIYVVRQLMKMARNRVGNPTEESLPEEGQPEETPPEEGQEEPW